jgi:NADH dehydrogenase
MRVAVLGGGYAGLVLTRKLEAKLPEGVELVLVDDTGEHLVQHELHRAIRDPAYLESISFPLDELLERATVREARVEGVNRGERTVELADGELGYDACAICLGARTDFHGLDTVREHATPLKRLDDARSIRVGFQETIERGGTAVVVGAGLSGVQTAGELAAFAEGKGTDAAVVLLERADTITPGFPENFRAAVREELDKLDVDVRTGVEVTGATGENVELADGEIAYDQFVWTGGVRGPAALGGEREDVRSTLALDERTFAVGDAARVVDAEGEVAPASAQAAVRATPVAAKNVCEAVAAQREGYDPRFEQWTFETPGWLISVGDSAVAQLGPEVFTGRVANAIKSSIGLTYLADHGSLRGALEVLGHEVGEDLPVLD